MSSKRDTVEVLNELMGIYRCLQTEDGKIAFVKEASSAYRCDDIVLKNWLDAKVKKERQHELPRLEWEDDEEAQQMETGSQKETGLLDLTLDKPDDLDAPEFPVMKVKHDRRVHFNYVVEYKFEDGIETERLNTSEKQKPKRIKPKQLDSAMISEAPNDEQHLIPNGVRPGHNVIGRHLRQKRSSGISRERSESPHRDLKNVYINFLQILSQDSIDALTKMYMKFLTTSPSSDSKREPERLYLRKGPDSNCDKRVTKTEAESSSVQTDVTEERDFMATLSKGGPKVSDDDRKQSSKSCTGKEFKSLQSSSVKQGEYNGEAQNTPRNSELEKRTGTIKKNNFVRRKYTAPRFSGKQTTVLNNEDTRDRGKGFGRRQENEVVTKNECYSSPKYSGAKASRNTNDKNFPISHWKPITPNARDQSEQGGYNSEKEIGNSRQKTARIGKLFDWKTETDSTKVKSQPKKKSLKETKPLKNQVEDAVQQNLDEAGRYIPRKTEIQAPSNDRSGSDRFEDEDLLPPWERAKNKIRRPIADFPNYYINPFAVANHNLGVEHGLEETGRYIPRETIFQTIPNYRSEFEGAKQLASRNGIGLDVIPSSAYFPGAEKVDPWYRDGTHLIPPSAYGPEIGSAVPWVENTNDFTKYYINPYAVPSRNYDLGAAGDYAYDPNVISMGPNQEALFDLNAAPYNGFGNFVNVPYVYDQGVAQIDPMDPTHVRAPSSYGPEFGSEVPWNQNANDFTQNYAAASTNYDLGAVRDYATHMTPNQETYYDLNMLPPNGFGNPTSVPYVYDQGVTEIDPRDRVETQQSAYGPEFGPAFPWNESTNGFIDNYTSPSTVASTNYDLGAVRDYATHMTPNQETYYDLNMVPSNGFGNPTSVPYVYDQGVIEIDPRDRVETQQSAYGPEFGPAFPWNESTNGFTDNYTSPSAVAPTNYDLGAVRDYPNVIHTAPNQEVLTAPYNGFGNLSAPYVYDQGVRQIDPRDMVETDAIPTRAYDSESGSTVPLNGNNFVAGSTNYDLGAAGDYAYDPNAINMTPNQETQFGVNMAPASEFGNVTCAPYVYDQGYQVPQYSEVLLVPFYCAFCHTNGSCADCSNHYMMTLDGKVICPHLAQVCRELQDYLLRRENSQCQ